MEENKEVLSLSEELGFSKTLFLNKDICLVEGRDKKKVLKEIKEGKKKNLFVVVKPESEEVLRFVLEKTSADMVFGQELINHSDSVHFRRGGLDQIICKIAVEKNKTIGFSFRDILESGGLERSKLMGRIIFNAKLCRKYGVKVFLSNFSEDKWEMRGVYELKAWGNVFGLIKQLEF
jgi:RNase P/RNase MRP subunit p30